MKPRKGKKDYSGHEYHCLVRAQDGHRKLSTVVQGKDLAKFHESYTTIQRVRGRLLMPVMPQAWWRGCRDVPLKQRAAATAAPPLDRRPRPPPRTACALPARAQHHPLPRPPASPAGAHGLAKEAGPHAACRRQGALGRGCAAAPIPRGCAVDSIHSFAALTFPAAAGSRRAGCYLAAQAAQPPAACPNVLLSTPSPLRLPLPAPALTSLTQRNQAQLPCQYNRLNQGCSWRHESALPTLCRHAAAAATPSLGGGVHRPMHAHTAPLHSTPQTMF